MFNQSLIILIGLKYPRVIFAPGSKRIYIFGGFDGNKWLNDLHVLDVGRLEARGFSGSK